MKRNLTIIVSVLLFGFALTSAACSENEQSAKNDATEVVGEKDSKLNKKPVCNRELAKQGITYEITLCLHADIDEKDKKLNEIYGELQKKLWDEAKEKLKKSQIDWIKFRDKEQDFIYSSYGGTFVQIMGLSAYLSSIERRIEDLESYLAALKLNPAGEVND